MPNSPTAGAPSAEALQYKATAVAAMREYLSSSDAAEVASTLQELQQPHLAHIFVKQVRHCHIIASQGSPWHLAYLNLKP